MIEVRDINKSFGPVRVLSDVSLTVSDGEYLTIVGPSGAGKTTLLQIIGTLEPADSGLVSFDGTTVTTMSASQRAHFRNQSIGFVFQSHQLLPEFTITENVAMPALIAGTAKKTALERARKILERLGLSHRLSHKPGQLSGGECQRAAVARAIINTPGVILADEPTGSLDSHNRQEIYELFERLNREDRTTIIVVTHDDTLASRSSRCVKMEDGRIITP